MKANFSAHQTVRKFKISGKFKEYVNHNRIYLLIISNVGDVRVIRRMFVRSSTISCNICILFLTANDINVSLRSISIRLAADFGLLSTKSFSKPRITSNMRRNRLTFVRTRQENSPVLCYFPIRV